MSFETEVVDFSPLISMSKMELPPLQAEYLEALKQKSSIENLVLKYLQKNVLISFQDMYELLQKLAEQNLIRNNSIQKLFPSTAKDPVTAANMASGESVIGTDTQQQLEKLPFFRTLKGPILDLFIKNSKISKVNKGIFITQAGRNDRDLFVLLKGSASVYKTGIEGGRQRVATISPGSVFGEVGFFIGQIRTADVIADTECEIVRIRFDEKKFPEIIKADKAEAIQKRFWILNALASSEFFREVPEDTFDSFIFAGKLIEENTDRVLFKEDDMGNSAYLIIQGSVVISKAGKTLRIMKQGECFGEVALMLNRWKRSASAKVQGKTLLLEIGPTEFYRLLSKNLILALRLEALAKSYFKTNNEKI